MPTARWDRKDDRVAADMMSPREWLGQLFGIQQVLSGSRLTMSVYIGAVNNLLFHNNASHFNGADDVVVVPKHTALYSTQEEAGHTLRSSYISRDITTPLAPLTCRYVHTRLQPRKPPSQSAGRPLLYVHPPRHIPQCITSIQLRPPQLDSYTSMVAQPFDTQLSHSLPQPV